MRAARYPCWYSGLSAGFSSILSGIAWGRDQGLVAIVPKAPRVHRTRKGTLAKSRAITFDEYGKIIRAIEPLVGAERRDSWAYLIRGLMLSGLRLSEALAMQWEPGPWPSPIIDDPERPSLRFPPGSQKSGRAEIVPTVPQFGLHLDETPEDQRVGKVFKPLGESGKVLANRYDVGREISAIGKAAKVFTDDTGKKPASAHDLRRLFGTYWAGRLMPVDLKALMRHAAIQTTMEFYVHTTTDQIHDRILGQEQKPSVSIARAMIDLAKWEAESKGDQSTETSTRDSDGT